MGAERSWGNGMLAPAITSRVCRSHPVSLPIGHPKRVVIRSFASWRPDEIVWLG